MARITDSEILSLIETIAQGQRDAAWEAAHRLIDARSRRYGRKLIHIAGAPNTAAAQQAALYAIWLLGETRAKSVLLDIGADIAGQPEGSRLIAVEALGNCSWRPVVQRALAKHLSDPALTVRYSALCALSAHHEPYPEFIKAALRRATQDTSSLYEEGDIAAFSKDLLTRQEQHYGPPMRRSAVLEHIQSLPRAERQSPIYYGNRDAGLR